jgi:hypothetical protein
MHLEHVLGEIDANRDNLRVDGSLIVIRFRRSPYGTSMPGAGAVHHIISGPEHMQEAMRQGALYSITCWARASSNGGPVRPSAFVGFRH